MPRKNKPSTPPPPPPPTVYCSDCPHFQRDTEGISYNRETKEFFMGICTLGLHPDNMRKVFANKPRRCPLHPQSTPPTPPCQN